MVCMRGGLHAGRWTRRLRSAASGGGAPRHTLVRTRPPRGFAAGEVDPRLSHPGPALTGSAACPTRTIGRAPPGRPPGGISQDRDDDHDRTSHQPARRLDVDAGRTRGIEFGQGRVPWARVARVADAGHHDPRQRPTPAGPARPARTGPARLDAGRHRGRGGAPARDYREPAVPDPARDGHPARARTDGTRPRHPAVSRAGSASLS